MKAEYNIATIADFLNVPEEKQAECLRDFAMWLNEARNPTIMCMQASEILGCEVTFKTETFTWIDDGIAGRSSFDFSENGGKKVTRFPMKVGAA